MRSGRDALLMATIYMPLLHEGTDVWRPVEASPLPGGTYRIDGEVPETEVWSYPPGAVVECEWKTFDSGERALTAIGLG